MEHLLLNKYLVPWNMFVIEYYVLAAVIPLPSVMAVFLEFSIGLSLSALVISAPNLRAPETLFG